MTLVTFLWILTCLISLLNLALVIRNHFKTKRRLAEWMEELEASDQEFEESMEQLEDTIREMSDCD